ncbi:MAG: hypothetical protein D3915_15465 [Candidatus Electrothrix sp. AU1_5]|nr:hypothetical protein [Candidatus Electrothrix gigas]
MGNINNDIIMLEQNTVGGRTYAILRPNHSDSSTNEHEIEGTNGDSLMAASGSSDPYAISDVSVEE